MVNDEPTIDLFARAENAPKARKRNMDWLEKLIDAKPKLGAQAESIIREWWAGDDRWRSRWPTKRALGLWLIEELDLDVQPNQACLVIDRLKP